MSQIANCDNKNKIISAFSQTNTKYEWSFDTLLQAQKYVTGIDA